MAITIDDFSKIWASTSPLTPYEFSEDNYKQGWNFVGGTPPSRQMWDFLQKNNDEKMQYLANNYLPLSGGTMTGVIRGNRSNNDFAITNSNADYGMNLYGYNNSENSGAVLQLKGKDALSNAGIFQLKASDGTNKPALVGNPDGSLTWNGVRIPAGGLGTAGSTAVTFTFPKQGSYLIISAHSSTAGTNGIWIYRATSTANNIFKMAGGENVTITPSGMQIIVQSSSGTANMFYIFLG